MNKKNQPMLVQMLSLSTKLVLSSLMVTTLFLVLSLGLSYLMHCGPFWLTALVIIFLFLFLHTNWATIISRQIKNENINEKHTTISLLKPNKRFFRVILLFLFITATFFLICWPVSLLNFVRTEIFRDFFDNNQIFNQLFIGFFWIALVCAEAIVIVAVNYLIYFDKEVLESLITGLKSISIHIYLFPLIIVYIMLNFKAEELSYPANITTEFILFASFYSCMSLLVMSKFYIKNQIKSIEH